MENISGFQLTFDKMIAAIYNAYGDELNEFSSFMLILNGDGSIEIMQNKVEEFEDRKEEYAFLIDLETFTSTVEEKYQESFGEPFNIDFTDLYY
ncbi:MAG TPA: hypothetical protein PKN22_05360 [Taishania sp.]|nr:hypothetical protein [Taishania sp.]